MKYLRFAIVILCTISLLSIAYAKANSVQEGVSLLEQILEKMHSMPQIALGYPRQGVVSNPQLLADNLLPKAARFNFAPHIGPSIAQQQQSISQLESLPPFVQNQTKVNTSDAQRLNESAESTQAKLPRVQSNLSVEPRASFYRTPRQYQIVDQRLLIRDFRAAPLPAPAYGGYAPSVSASPALMNPTQDNGPTAKRVRRALLHANHAEPSLAEDKKAIAMSPPPTIITGIPLVRLGSSEKEMTKAISSFGKLHKDVFHSWSVWSLQKDKSTDFAIQVFVRHGIVDAIRVFDKSFLQADFGIHPGDQLSSVKTKFGEPAFILSDAGTTSSQNYIYPVSQVGFQLARIDKTQSPKIASILIFSVK